MEVDRKQYGGFWALSQAAFSSSATPFPAVLVAQDDWVRKATLQRLHGQTRDELLVEIK